MNSKIITAARELLEKLASIEHERWSAWQSYLHSKCKRNKDGSLVIPSELVARWERQINTKYEDLSEGEKDSDRSQVLRYLPTVKKYMRMICNALGH